MRSIADESDARYALPPVCVGEGVNHAWDRRAFTVGDQRQERRMRSIELRSEARRPRARLAEVDRVDPHRGSHQLDVRMDAPAGLAVSGDLLGRAQREHGPKVIHRGGTGMLLIDSRKNVSTNVAPTC
jgi:hypothetical protein